MYRDYMWSEAYAGSEVYIEQGLYMELYSVSVCIK